MVRPAATWHAMLLQQRMKLAGDATHIPYPVQNPSLTTWGAHNNRWAEPAMESEWLLIGGKVIAKVLIWLECALQYFFDLPRKGSKLFKQL